MFRAALESKLPNIATYSEAAIVCNARIQEFLSAMKQLLATKKGFCVVQNTCFIQLCFDFGINIIMIIFVEEFQ